MITRYTHMIETSIEDKKQFIKDQVDELDPETINRIYDIINSISPEAKQQIDSFMKSVGLTFIQDNILNIFEKNGDFINYLNYINDGKMLKFKEIVNKTEGNIFDICEKNTPIGRNSLKRLAKEKSSSNGVQVGEYEFLLRLMIGGASETLVCKRGDVTAEGIAVEVKSGKPRITGAGTKPAETIRDTLNKLLYDKYGNQISAATNNEFNGPGGMKVPGRFFEGLYEKLKSLDKDADNSMIEIITKSYMSQWPEDMMQYEDMVSAFVSKHIFSGKKIDTNEINNIIATIGLFCYSCAENFDRFLVFAKETGDFICIDTTDKNNGLLESIYDKFSSDKLHITCMQNEANTLTGKGIQFQLK